MAIADINGVKLSYEVVGQGPAVVFLHGLGGNAGDWANQASALSSKYRVITRDMRGHGVSGAPSNPDEYSVPVFADDVFALLDMLGIRKCCLAGHSIGGYIALQFALEHPDKLTALVLVDTSSGQVAMDPEYAKRRQKLNELARFQGMEAAFEYDAANNPLRIERFREHPEAREVIRQKMLRTSVDGYIYSAKAIAQWTPVTSRLAEIKVPTLICCGEKDAGFIEAVRVLEKGIAGSQLVMVKGAGHSPHEETPAVFNDVLLNFLSRLKW